MWCIFWIINRDEDIKYFVSRIILILLKCIYIYIYAFSLFSLSVFFIFQDKNQMLHRLYIVERSNFILSNSQSTLSKI
jgi:hypothetical protein